MKKGSLSPTLSAHLLEVADGFLGYPERQRRDRHANRAVKLLDDKLRIIFEWRKTFAPPEVGDAHKVLSDTGLLDEFYSRDVLRAVPEMVKRTRRLASLTLRGLPDDASLVYLRESVNSYILGLSQASIALARAAIEAAVTRAVMERGGKKMAEKQFSDRLRYAAEKRLLSPHGRGLAANIWAVGSDALHRLPAGPDTALRLLEDARSVVFELALQSPAKDRGVNHVNA